jgi:hypothetical protein
VNAETLELPPGWFVLWCPVCCTSICWTKADMNTFDFDEWLGTQSWFADQVDHDMSLHPEER